MEQEVGHHAIVDWLYCPECGADKFDKNFGCWSCGACVVQQVSELKEAVDIIEHLMSVQNGCPLEKYRKSFDEANRRGQAFINKHFDMDYSNKRAAKNEAVSS
jgi:hypothetical protein